MSQLASWSQDFYVDRHIFIEAEEPTVLLRTTTFYIITIRVRSVPLFLYINFNLGLWNYVK